MYENNAIETAIISGNIVSEQDAEKALNKYNSHKIKILGFLWINFQGDEPVWGDRGYDCGG